MLNSEFFAEDTGFKLELLNKEHFVANQDNMIKFRLRVTDQKKREKGREKPAHKENEAIEFDFNLESDNCLEVSSNMIKSGILLMEEDAKKVGKMMENQVNSLLKDREEHAKHKAQEQLELQEQQQVQQQQQQQQQAQQQQVQQQQHQPVPQQPEQTQQQPQPQQPQYETQVAAPSQDQGLVPPIQSGIDNCINIDRDSDLIKRRVYIIHQYFQMPLPRTLVTRRNMTPL